jgi:hypothetical protein
VIPDGLTARIGIPKVGKEIMDIRMDGELVYASNRLSEDQSTNPLLEEDFVILHNMKGGVHTFKVSYEGEAPGYTQLKMKYPVPTVWVDTLTSGNWGGVYGSEGYILCAYLSDGDTVQDLRSLPAYVGNITYSKQQGKQWVDGAGDQRAPSRGERNEYPRNAGAIHTQDPLATLQTMTVDIQMDEGKSHQIALYFLDWEEAGRRVAVEMFDLDSKRLLAPVQVVSDFANGKYLIYSYDAPVRFRINHVRGPNATLSGIFFD